MASRLAFANAPTDARFVFVLLRGALDGLSAVPPVGDPDYAALRGQIALAKSGEGAALPLDGTFGLHPVAEIPARRAMPRRSWRCCMRWPRRTASARTSTRRTCSRAATCARMARTSGWINRALGALPAGKSREAGVALGANVPLAMRGPAEVASWSPTKIAALDEETLARITDLYARDPLLSQRLAEALESDAIANEAQAAANARCRRRDGRRQPTTSSSATRRQKRNYNARYTETARAAAGFLKRDDGPRVAMFDTTGWDTHANEGGAQGQLALRLRGLDAAHGGVEGIPGAGVAQHRGAGGHGVRPHRGHQRHARHGSRHRRGGIPVRRRGGRRTRARRLAGPVARRACYENRDLKPTRDLRAVMKGVLRDHLGVAAAALDSKVFPDSAGRAAAGRT